jgi:regulator of protease activity HflC (stomatin/prohibitin superfamily)
MIFVWIIGGIVVFTLVITSIKIVNPWEKGLIERLGRYQRTVGSGLIVILPFCERIQKVDMREQVVDVTPQTVSIKDNVAVEVDAVVYLEVTDPVKATYEVANFYFAVINLAQTSIRTLMGDMALDELLASREAINTKLRKVLNNATASWGIRVTRIELKRIEPPLP